MLKVLISAGLTSNICLTEGEKILRMTVDRMICRKEYVGMKNVSGFTWIVKFERFFREFSSTFPLINIRNWLIMYVTGTKSTMKENLSMTYMINQFLML